MAKQFANHKKVLVSAPIEVLEELDAEALERDCSRNLVIKEVLRKHAQERKERGKGNGLSNV